MVHYLYRKRYLKKSLDFTTLCPLLLGKLIKKGLKVKAFNVLKFAIGYAKYRVRVSGLILLETVFNNVRPRVDLLRRIVSGRTYYLPFAIKMKRDIKLAVSWVVLCARRLSGVSSNFGIRLGQMFVDTFFNKGLAIAKKNEHYSLVLKNRPFLSKRKFRIFL